MLLDSASRPGSRSSGPAHDGVPGLPPPSQPRASSGSRRDRRARALGLVLGAALTLPTLAACGGEAGAASSSPVIAQSDIDRIASAAAESRASASVASPPTRQSSPGGSSAAASASPAEFVLPEAAKAHTQDGAKAFVKFYWEMLEQLDKAPRSGVVPAFTAPTCTSCVRQEENLAHLAADRATVSSRNRKSSPLTVRSDSTTDSVVVQFRYSDAGSSHVRDGKTIQTFPPLTTLTETRADWTTRGWRIGEIGNVASK